MKVRFLPFFIVLAFSGFIGTANAVDGILRGVYTYSYIKGHQLYWNNDFKEPTSCTNGNQMTINGGDLNAQAMISMSYIAFTTGMNLNCVPKAGCNGINSNAEANYCFLTK